VRRTRAVAACALAMGLVGCSTSAPSQPTASVTPGTTAPAPSRSSAAPTPTSASPTSSPVDSATPDPSVSPTAVALTDYGALLSVWAAHHDPDERFDPGAMWDPTPGWGPDEAHNDKFNETVVTGGRVLRYDMYLPRSGVTAAKAITLATSALPADATVLWRQQFPSCYVVQLTSPSLGAVLAAKPFRNPQGQVQLQLRSGSPSGAPDPFNPANVASVLVRPAQAATAADFAGC
jgi:hypothetical protein